MDSAKLLNMLEAQIKINEVQAKRIEALEAQKKRGIEKKKEKTEKKKAKKEDGEKKPKKSPTCTVCKLPMKKNDHSKCKKAE